MNNDEGPLLPNSQQYTDLRVHPSPVGEFRECLHIQSGQRRGLKVIKPSLSEHQMFFGWYRSALTLSGLAAEHLNLPCLIAPLKTPDGDWFSVRAGECTVERPFFGGKKHPAWNLSGFVDEFASQGRGVDELVALAVLSQITEILTTMHGTKMAAPEGVQLNGIPHLNLKPENIIIGQHIRSQLYEVRLTDFLIATSSPLAEQAGVKSPLNYSALDILEDQTYYGLDADIFSCGLLLYRLLENKDLLPVDRARPSLIEFIRNDLPLVVKNLQLSDARSRSRVIIQRCLSVDENERYGSAAELYKEVEQILRGKDAATIIKTYIEKPKGEESPIQESFDWKKYIKPVGIGVAALVVVVLAWVGLSSFFSGNTEQEALDSQVRIANLWADVKKGDCTSWSSRKTLKKSIQEADSLIIAEEFDPAKNIYKTLEPKLSKIAQNCNSFRQLRSDGDVTRKNRGRDKQFAQIWPEFVSLRDRAGDYILDGDFARASQFIDSARGYLDSLEPEDDQLALTDQADDDVITDDQPDTEPDLTVGNDEIVDLDDPPVTTDDDQGTPVDEPVVAIDDEIEEIPEWVCGDGMSKLSVIIDELSGDCAEQGERLFSRARRACGEADSISFALSRSQLLTLSVDSACMGEIDTCAEDTEMYANAKKQLNDFRDNFRGVPYKGHSSYKQAVSAFETATGHMENEDCAKAGFHAKTALSALRSVHPCVNLMADVRQVRSCVGENSAQATYGPQVKALERALSICNCEDAEVELTSLKTLLGDAFACFDVATYTDCLELVKHGSADAWKTCEQVPESDPRYQDAMKDFLIQAGKQRLYINKSFRKRFQKAYDGWGGDHSNYIGNVGAYITMICIYGWDRKDMNVGQALFYFSEVNRMGSVTVEHEDWWRAMLVLVRCNMARWRSNPNVIQLRTEALRSAQNFNAFVESKNISGRGQYVKEVNNYIREINPNLR